MFRAHWSKKLRERNFARHFVSLKYISFCWKLLYLLIIFWKIIINTFYEQNGSRKISSGEFPHEKLLTINLPSPRKIPTRNIPTHFINCLSSPNTSFWQIFKNVKDFSTFKTELQNSALSNISDDIDNNEKKFGKLGREYNLKIITCTCIDIDLHQKIFILQTHSLRI